MPLCLFSTGRSAKGGLVFGEAVVTAMPGAYEDHKWARSAICKGITTLGLLRPMQGIISRN